MDYQLQLEQVKQSLHKRYGENPPKEVLSRFNHELNYFLGSSFLRHWEFLGTINRLAWSRGEHTSITGIPGISLMAWLSDATQVNPLPPHERCPKCGKISFHKGVKDGWDLPQRTCECGAEFIRDGHNIPLDPKCTALGSYSFHVSAPLELRDEITKVFRNFYSDFLSAEALDTTVDLSFWGQQEDVVDKFVLEKAPDKSLDFKPATFSFRYSTGWGRMDVQRNECGFPSGFPSQELLANALQLPELRKYCQDKNIILEFSNVLRVMASSIQHQMKFDEGHVSHVFKNGEAICREDVLEEIVKALGEEGENHKALHQEIAKIVLGSHMWGSWKAKEKQEDALISLGIPESIFETIPQNLYLAPKFYLIEYLINTLAELLR